MSEFERLRKLYREGRITEKGLNKAVSLGIITEEEKQLIIEENNG